MNWIRLFEKIHGHLGILATAALLHPALLMRRGKPLSKRTRWSVALSSSFALVAYGAGLFIYSSYTHQLKRAIFYVNPRAGMLFETKEHLAFSVVCLALGGLVAAQVAPRDGNGLRRAAAVAYAFAALAALMVVGLGMYVATVKGF
jgi:hypothetical protein